jgi:hypothetical protein
MEASAERLFESLPPQQREQVEAVVMDMTASMSPSISMKRSTKVRRTEHRKLPGGRKRDPQGQ